MGRDDSPLQGALVFIVGARRSGTNWIERIVGAHPDVAVIPNETYLFASGVQPLVERFHHAAPGLPHLGGLYAPRAVLVDAVRDFCDAVFLPLRDALVPQATRLVERTPWHVHHLDLIGEVYPDASVVHVLRDGRDVVRSLLAQPWGPTDLAEAAEEWRRAVDDGRRAAGQLSHLVEVRYERMLADPEAETRALYRGLGLSCTDEVLSAAVAESGIPYNVDPSAPTPGVGKWRETFGERDLATFDAIAGDAMESAGYDRARSTGPTRLSSPASPASPPTRPWPARPWRRLRRALTRASAPWTARRDRRAAVHAAEEVVRRFLDALAAGAGLEPVLAPSVRIRFVSGERSWEARGEQARCRLEQEIAADASLRGRQLRGDVHPSLQQFTAVLRYESAEGSSAQRVFVVGVSGDRVGRLACYFD